MRTPAIPHFGTTLFEAPPAEGVAQADVPFGGSLARTDRFLRLFGMEPFLTNLYPGVGRQYIYRRGDADDADYVEKDTFTSYRAEVRPEAPGPRVADTIVRVAHPQPEGVLRSWLDEDLVTATGPDGEIDAFLAGDAEAVLVRGPDDQVYELTRSAPDRVDNHAVFIWTDPADVDTVAASYRDHFALDDAGSQDFHGLGTVRLLRRGEAPVTIGLVTPTDGAALAPRWTDDIFAQVGYTHFRLGAPDKAKVLSVSDEAFPDTGDVSYVHFHHAYLELVEY